MGFIHSWSVRVSLGALALGILLQVPQLVHQLDPRAHGIMVHLNSDEYVYLARVQESLSGRSKQATEAFIGDADLVGSQFALLEQVYGTVFRFTGLRAAVVLQIMDFVMGFFLFILLFAFFRQCGFSPGRAYTGTILFIIVTLAGLNRPVHQLGSFVITLSALNALIAGFRGWRVLGIIGGILAGLLIGIYFWSFTFVWAWMGVVFCWLLLDVLTRASGREEVFRHLRRVALFALVGVVASVPFLLKYASLFSHPLYEVAAFRSGMHLSHLPESWFYSSLFVSAAGGVLFTLLHDDVSLKPYTYAVVTFLAAVLVMHQQVIHGVIFNFVSHYLYALVLGALCVVLIAWSLPKMSLLVAGFAMVVYLAAVAYDGRWVIAQYTGRSGDFGEQHFSTLLPVLDALPRARILSDPETTSFIAGSTKHDIVYSIYLKNVLLTHEEIAERYCLTQIPIDPPSRHIAEQEWLIYPDANAALKDDPTVREEELRIMSEACDRIQSAPDAFLKSYSVEYILWDEKRNPAWDLARFRSALEKVAVAKGWSLWRIAN